MKQELPIPPAVESAEKTMEIARVWIADGDQHFTISQNLWKDPGSWGLLFVDLARHVANAYAQRGAEREQVLHRIRAAFDAEWEHPTE